MPKIILFIASSLDGFIARPDGGIDWLFGPTGAQSASDYEDYGYKKFYASVGSVMMGRKTYDVSVGFGEKHYGKKWIVFTRRKMKNTGNVVFTSDVIGTIRKMLRSEKKDIWLVGGSEIISILMKEKLIDKIILSVHPIILGNGIVLFKNVDENKLKLEKTVEFPSGIVQIWYDAVK